MKDPMYRDRALLDLAERQHCLVRVPDVCNLDPRTTVAAHSNQARHGKGKGIKAHDGYSVWACARCHHWLDSSMAAELPAKVAAWNRAHDRQIVAWRAIADNIALKPVAVRAARAVLVWLKEREVIA